MNIRTAICVICSSTFESRTSYYGLCPLCYSRDKLREYDRLQSAIYHAERAKLPIALSLPQWLSTISDFRGLCAYCLEMPFGAIEMVNISNGLAWGNVVPCCRACLAHRKKTFKAAEERVQAYLANMQGDAEVCSDEGVETMFVPAEQALREILWGE